MMLFRAETPKHLVVLQWSKAKKMLVYFTLNVNFDL